MSFALSHEKVDRSLNISALSHDSRLAMGYKWLMAMPRFAKTRDLNESDVFMRLRARGWAIEPMDVPCDALAARRGRVHCVEIKNPERGRNAVKKLTPAQKAFRLRWKTKGCLHVGVDDEDIHRQLVSCESS